MTQLFEKVLDSRLRIWAERVGVLSDLQGGFRHGRGCLDQIFILNEILSKRREMGLSSFLAFIDVKKAYDRVWRDGLWHKVEATGADEHCVKMLKAMFARVIRSVHVNGGRTEEFDVTVGVPQGSVLSPLLYAIFINGLHQALRQAGLGMRVYGRLVPLLLYADDIVLLARNAKELQAMLVVLQDYAKTWRFQINKKKSNVVVHGQLHKPWSDWSLDGEELLWTQEYKYLGAETGKTRGRWNSMLGRIFQKASNALNMVLWQAGGGDSLPARIVVRQWIAMVRPIVEYGAELWHGEISKSWSKKLERLQRSLCSAVLKLQGNVATVGMHAELGLLSLADRRVCLKLGYYQRLCDASEDRLLSLIFRRRHAEVERGAAPHSGLQSMRVAMADAGFAKEWRARDCGAGDWVSEVKLAVTERAALVQREEMAQRSTLAEYVRLGLRPLKRTRCILTTHTAVRAPSS